MSRQRDEAMLQSEGKGKRQCYKEEKRRDPRVVH